MKLILFIFIIVSAAGLFSSSPHPVMIELQNSDGSLPFPEGLTFLAWRINNPDYALDLSSTDCYYPAFGVYLHINCGSFPVWNPVDTLHVEVFDDIAEEWYSQNYVLNGENIQTFDIGEGGMILGVRLDLPEQAGFRYYDGLTLDLEEYLSYMWDDEYLITVEGNENITIELDSLLMQFSADGSWFGSESLEITFDSNSFRTVVVDTIEVEVYPNHAPEFTFPPEGLSFNEDEELNLDLLDYCSDFDNDSLFFAVEGFQTLICELDDNNLNITSPANWFGSETISVSAEDGQSRILASVEVTINVIAVNDPPQLMFPESVEADEDNPVQFPISDVIFDIEDDSLSITGSGFVNTALEVQNEIINIIPGANWFGSETVIISVFDQTDSVNDTISVIINPVNDPPAINLPEYQTLPADLPMSIDLTPYMFDVDNENTDLSLSAESQNLSFSFLGLIADITAIDNWHGSEDVIFTVDDGVQRISASDTMRINCFLLEDAMIDIGNVTVDEGDYLEIDINTSEIFEHWSVSSYGFSLSFDSYYLSYLGNTLDETIAAGGSVDISVEQNEFTTLIDVSYSHYLPITGEGSILKLWLQANCFGEVIIEGSDFYYNNQAISDPADGIIIVNDIGNTNHPPQANAGEDITVSAGESASLNASLSWDPDAAELDYLWQTPPEIILDDPLSITPLFTAPVVSENTDFEVTLQVTDPDQNTSSDIVLITVLYQNFPPEINLPEEIELNEDEQLNADFTQFLFDENGDDLSLYSTGSANITVEISGLVVNFIPAADWFGSEIITFTVSDEVTRLQSSDSLLINVLPVNDPPQADAGDDIYIRDGEQGMLDAGSSFDIDNEEITFFWSAGDFVSIEYPDSMQTLFTAATCEDSLIGTVYLIVDDQQARLIDTDSLLITIMDDEVRNLEAVNLGEGEVELSWLQPYAFTPDVSYDVYLDSVIVNNTTENNIVITTDTGLHDFGVKAEYYDGFSELVTIQLEVTAYNKEELPLVSGIRSIFPNPFNPETTINYDLAEDGYVSISVYNLKGQKVVELVNITQKAGQNSVVLNADRLASGVYFVRMNTGNTNQVQKVILMK